jgi:adenosylcobyric acid synthase
VLGICGGYQMLGQSIADPEGIEGPSGEAPGLGYLPVRTRLARQKRVARVSGTSRADGAPFSGYEIHAGVTTGNGVSPLLRFADGRADGAVSPDGRIAGCYVHGLFDAPEQRVAWLGRLGVASDGHHRAVVVDAALDELAAALEESVSVDALLRIAQNAT